MNILSATLYRKDDGGEFVRETGIRAIDVGHMLKNGYYSEPRIPENEEDKESSTEGGAEERSTKTIKEKEDAEVLDIDTEFMAVFGDISNDQIRKDAKEAGIENHDDAHFKTLKRKLIDAYKD